jgi:hypothetical protein
MGTLHGMEHADEERAGVLVLRAWVEAGATHGLRVRITRSIRSGPAEPVSSASATVDGVCAVIRGRLEAPPPITAKGSPHSNVSSQARTRAGPSRSSRRWRGRGSLLVVMAYILVQTEVSKAAQVAKDIIDIPGVQEA